MEVKPGYKHTEVGVIPRDWEVKSISEFSNIKTGPFGTLLKADEYSEDTGVPLISVGEVGLGHFRVTERTPRIPENVVRRLPQYVLRTGDSVFGRKGAVDRSAIVTEEEDGWFLGSDGICIRPDDICHPPYLAAQFQRYEVQTWLLNNAIGTTMASLNQSILGRGQIPFAPPPEQRAIAEALGDVDALLDSLDSLIAKKRDLKQAAMQQLLTAQTRLPGFSGRWEPKTIEDLADVGRGRVISHREISKSTESIYPVYSSQTSNDGVMGYLATFDFEGNYITWTTDGANAGTVFARSGKFNCTNVCGTIKVRNGDHRFIASALGRVSKYYVSRHLGNPKLMNDVMKKIEVSIPPETEEQTAIAEVLSDMDAELAALETRREKTRALKQAMMQELLTGKTRLVESHP